MVHCAGNKAEGLLTDRSEPKGETFKVRERQIELADALTWVLKAQEPEVWSIGRVELDGIQWAVVEVKMLEVRHDDLGPVHHWTVVVVFLVHYKALEVREPKG